MLSTLISKVDLVVLAVLNIIYQYQYQTLSTLISKVDLMVLAILLLGEGELLDPPVCASLGPLKEKKRGLDMISKYEEEKT